MVYCITNPYQIMNAIDIQEHFILLFETFRGLIREHHKDFHKVDFDKVLDTLLISDTDKYIIRDLLEYFLEDIKQDSKVVTIYRKLFDDELDEDCYPKLYSILNKVNY